METTQIIDVALAKCANQYNPRDLNEWIEKKSYHGIATDLSRMFTEMGYELKPNKKVHYLENPDEFAYLDEEENNLIG